MAKILKSKLWRMVKVAAEGDDEFDDYYNEACGS
jgi:hypothetical protein